MLILPLYVSLPEEPPHRDFVSEARLQRAHVITDAIDHRAHENTTLVLFFCTALVCGFGSSISCWGNQLGFGSN